MQPGGNIVLSGVRYAIYFTPAAGSQLWRFGTAALGYDAYVGAVVAADQRGALASILEARHISEPARYGFHATLRAPFELKPAVTPSDLVRAAHAFAGVQPIAELGRLKVAAMGSFVALVPSSPCEAVMTLAQRCVEHFEPFRAPLSAGDMARRRQADLSPSQIALLGIWGYPYVFDEFRFHMSLTGRLAEQEMSDILPALRLAYSELDQPVQLDSISVLEQRARDRPFRIVDRVPLRAG